MRTPTISDPKQEYDFAQSLTAFADREPKKFKEWCEREASKGYGSITYFYRLVSIYRIFCVSLGYGPDIFSLGMVKLLELRKKINWDYRKKDIPEWKIGNKWTKKEAQYKIKRILQAQKGNT